MPSFDILKGLQSPTITQVPGEPQQEQVDQQQEAQTNTGSNVFAPIIDTNLGNWADKMKSENQAILESAKVSTQEQAPVVPKATESEAKSRFGDWFDNMYGLDYNSQNIYKQQETSKKVSGLFDSLGMRNIENSMYNNLYDPGEYVDAKKKKSLLQSQPFQSTYDFIPGLGAVHRAASDILPGEDPFYNVGKYVVGNTLGFVGDIFTSIGGLLPGGQPTTQQGIETIEKAKQDYSDNTARRMDLDSKFSRGLIDLETYSQQMGILDNQRKGIVDMFSNRGQNFDEKKMQTLFEQYDAILSEQDKKRGSAIDSAKARQKSIDTILGVKSSSYDKHQTEFYDTVNKSIDINNIPAGSSVTDISDAIGGMSSVFQRQIQQGYEAIQSQRREVAKSDMTQAEKEEQYKLLDEAESMAGEMNKRSAEYASTLSKYIQTGVTGKEAAKKADEELMNTKGMSWYDYLMSADTSFNKESDSYQNMTDRINERIEPVRYKTYGETNIFNNVMGSTAEFVGDVQRTRISPFIRKNPSTALGTTIGWEGGKAVGASIGKIAPHPGIKAGAAYAGGTIGAIIGFLGGGLADIAGLHAFESEGSLAKLNVPSAQLYDVNKDNDNDYLMNLNLRLSDYSDNLISGYAGWKGMSALNRFSGAAGKGVFNAGYSVLPERARKAIGVAAKTSADDLIGANLGRAVGQSRAENVGKAISNIYLENGLINGMIQPGISESYSADPMNFIFDIGLTSSIEGINALRSVGDFKRGSNIVANIQGNPIAAAILGAGGIKNPTMQELKDVQDIITNVSTSTLNSLAANSSIDANTFIKTMMFNNEVLKAGRESIAAGGSQYGSMKQLLLDVMGVSRTGGLLGESQRLADKSKIISGEKGLEVLRAAGIQEGTPVYNRIMEMKAELTNPDISLTDMISNNLVYKEGDAVKIKFGSIETVVDRKSTFKTKDAEIEYESPIYQQISGAIADYEAKNAPIIREGVNYGPVGGMLTQKQMSSIEQSVKTLPDGNPMKSLLSEGRLFEGNTLSDDALNRLGVVKTPQQASITDVNIKIQKDYKDVEGFQDTYYKSISSLPGSELVTNTNIYKNMFEAVRDSLPRDLYC